MAREKALEAALEKLAAVRVDPSSAESRATLRSVLAGRSNHAAAQAAALIAAHEISGLEAELVATFDRLLEDPVRRDPGCAAKAAIADALYRLNAPEAHLYQRGLRHVQMEPVYGGKRDT